MLSITHALVGASIANKIKNPFLSLPLVFAFHFLTDFIPHWDLGVNFGKRSKIKNFFLASLDALIGFLSVFLLFQLKKPLSPLLWLNTSISLLPDILEAPAHFLGFSLFPRLDDFHIRVFHRKDRNPFWGIIPQLLIIGIVILSR